MTSMITMFSSVLGSVSSSNQKVNESGFNGPRSGKALPENGPILLAQASGPTQTSAQTVSRETRGAWTGYVSRFVKTLSGGSIVYDANNKRAPSEGMGYGMFLAASTGDQKTFEALSKGADAYFRKPNGLFRWVTTADGKPHPKTGAIQNPDASATDADIYIAASLILAHKNGWAPASGASYLERAQRTMDAIWANDIITKGTRLIIKPTDGTWPIWGDGHVVFNPSYFTPTHLKLFAEMDKNPAHDWKKVISDGYDLMSAIMAKKGTTKPKGQNPFPDNVLLSVSGNNYVIESYNRITPDNEYDAIRVPIEIGRDAIINKDQKAIGLLSEFLKASGADQGVKVGGWSNELAQACYAVAYKGAGRNNTSLVDDVRSSFQGNYFGASDADAKDYYKQSLVTIASLLIF